MRNYQSLPIGFYLLSFFYTLIKLKFTNMKTIYLVIEQGAGYIHKAFISEYKAEQHVKQLEQETGFECFEVQNLDLCEYLPTIEELEKAGRFPTLY